MCTVVHAVMDLHVKVSSLQDKLLDIATCGRPARCLPLHVCGAMYAILVFALGSVQPGLCVQMQAQLSAGIPRPSKPLLNPHTGGRRHHEGSRVLA